MSTIRVWWRGPVRIVDKNGERIEGEFSDLPPETRATWEIGADGMPNGRHSSTILDLQEIDRAVFAWVCHNQLFPESRIESGLDTAKRNAANAAREECARIVEDDMCDSSIGEAKRQMVARIRARKV